MQQDESRHGVLLAIMSAIAFSTAGLFTRLILLDTWTVLFWRGLFAGLFVAGWIAWLYRARSIALVRAIGWAGLAAALCGSLATICSSMRCA